MSLRLRAGRWYGEGFTLLELLAATAVALITGLAVTSAVVSGTAAAAQARARADAACAIASLAEELRSLPFGPGADGARSLLEVAFPNASSDAAPGVAAGAETPDEDAPARFFSAVEREGCPAGTFFSLLSGPETCVRVAATFVWRRGAAWVAVPPAALEGYTPSCPPSEALLLRFAPEQDAGGSWWLTTLVCPADRPAEAAEAAP